MISFSPEILSFLSLQWWQNYANISIIFFLPSAHNTAKDIILDHLDTLQAALLSIHANAFLNNLYNQNRLPHYFIIILLSLKQILKCLSDCVCLNEGRKVQDGAMVFSHKKKIFFKNDKTKFEFQVRLLVLISTEYFWQRHEFISLHFIPHYSTSNMDWFYHSYVMIVERKRKGE